ncbi:MAG: type 1 glutamine amidotransferase [Deltaproteobacteria bacterium]|nr:type 1 glutamine amidotransferase [Deltaproteobacteria bacterium]
MRAHYFQHVSFEGLGSIEPWLHAAGYRIGFTRFFQEDRLPELEDIDLLIVLGGPMSVHDTEKYPWLIAEQGFIREAVAAGKAVLGICLGAQLIAAACGGAVYRNRFKEIGWFPVLGMAAEGPAFRFPPVVEAFHWHGETFDPPPEAVLLARSEGCENQAFQLGRRVIGLQFHLETTSESARQIVAQCRDELIPSEYVQTESVILAAPPEKYRTINALMGELLTYLTGS